MSNTSYRGDHHVQQALMTYSGVDSNFRLEDSFYNCPRLSPQDQFSLDFLTPEMPTNKSHTHYNADRYSALSPSSQAPELFLQQPSARHNHRTSPRPPASSLYDPLYAEDMFYAYAQDSKFGLSSHSSSVYPTSPSTPLRSSPSASSKSDYSSASCTSAAHKRKAIDSRPASACQSRDEDTLLESPLDEEARKAKNAALARKRRAGRKNSVSRIMQYTHTQAERKQAPSENEVLDRAADALDAAQWREQDYRSIIRDFQQITGLTSPKEACFRRT
ncbi:hypothetical protein EVG20_g7525 [Dentipellis fragilis]|uniref:BZIP domain-containing protein n=1 Tax=Dentipellis fragilis TaxID=205917 RepID=A0A4Y9YFC6_9AGAM|nr:hypothetical protein EVG20_g7525 [Dentipellis fragilis]